MTAFHIFRKKPTPKKAVVPKKRPKVSVKEEKPAPPVKKVEKKPSFISLTQGEEENLILHPHFSEKTTAGEKERKYVFSVTPQAKRIEVKKAIENIYKVKVIKVNILKSFTRSKRWGSKIANFQKEKKAIVTLAEGQKIELGI